MNFIYASARKNATDLQTTSTDIVTHDYLQIANGMGCV